MAFGKCGRDCWREKRNHCVTSALFCQRDFSATSKLSKQNRRKIPIPKQIRAYYIFQDILKIFWYVYALFFKQMRKCNRLYRSSLFACFFFQEILDPTSLELIWSYNYLASIPRLYCRVSYRNSVPKMRISGNVFCVFERMFPCHLLNE